jgi:uncharacterized membrane protein SirB2
MGRWDFRQDRGMSWIDGYTAVRQLHLLLVTASVGLFAVRGGALLVGQRWPMGRRWRVASVLIDTLLLGAGAGLWWMLALNPLRDAWLGSKLLFLLLYIGLGWVALRRAQRPGGRGEAFIAWTAALACAAFMVSVARLHSPAGIFGTLF